MNSLTRTTLFHRISWHTIKRAMGGTEKEPIVFDVIPEERFSEVIEHLRKNFFWDEPLNRAVGLCPIRGAPHRELENVSLNTMKQGLSLMATSGDDRGPVIGVALNGISRPGDLDEAENKLTLIPDPKFRSIFGLLNEANRKLSLFERYDVDRIFELRIFSVDESARGRGLANELLRRSMELARKEGFRLIKADTTGCYSQHMAAKGGLETVLTIMYDTYKDKEGKIVFQTNPPHDSLKIMIKRI